LIVQKSCFLIILLGSSVVSRAQTLGGNSVFNFLKFSNTPQLTALGGINISQQTEDIGLSFHNPALLRESMHTQTHFAFSSFSGAVRNYHLLTGYHSEKLKTNFALGVNYFNYGVTTQTDPAGNILGEFRPADYVIQVSASRKYLERWHYGASFKFIYSSYGAYRSSGIALDAGVTYTDTSNLLQVALSLKNMGVQLKAYEGTEKNDLPFDLQMGISKRLARAPIQFSLTLHHLHQFNLKYDDSSFNADNGFEQDEGKSMIGDKIFRHIVLATQLFISDKIEISAGYNYLRRKELNTGGQGNGLNGFSFGVGILVKKIQIRYARTYYQNNFSNNQIGISISFNQFSPSHSN